MIAAAKTAATERESGFPLALPLSLRAVGVRLRNELAGDEVFLERLYIGVRWDELSQVQWPDEAKVAFLRDQHRLQRHHYLTHYADADFGIVLANEEPAGRLYLYRAPHDIRIVDVSLTPPARGKGIGSALLGAVL